MAGDKKTIVISGGSGGVGRASAEILAREGWNVVLLYLNTPSRDMDAFLKTLASGGHLAIQCDIREPETMRTAIKHIVAKYGQIDACVHAAVDPLVRKCSGRNATHTPGARAGHRRASGKHEH